MASNQRYNIWTLSLLLLELLPGSLQLTHLTKRQVIFPEHDLTTTSLSCITPDRRLGNCIPITSCPPLLKERNRSQIRRFQCTLENGELGICCPQTNFNGITTTSTTRRPIPFSPVPSPPSDDELNDNNMEVMPSFLPKECGKTKHLLKKVIGGREAKKGAWPWMAVVYKGRYEIKSPSCGGALVTNQHVVTAAHCVVDARAQTLSSSAFRVRLGEHDLNSNEDEMNPVDVDVSSVEKHENYNRYTYENDIAVLKLARPVQFNDNISTICLPYDSLRNEDLAEKRAYIAGWGSTSFGGPSSEVLREASFEIQDQDMCKEAYKSELLITDSYICAGTLDGSKDSCEGDSGGPLMSVGKEKRLYLVGIVSFGINCATPGYAGVYTRTTKYLDWLLTRVNT